MQTTLRDPAQHAALFDPFWSVRPRDDEAPGGRYPARRHVGSNAHTV
ncbi:TPA: hypothetical protein QDB02_001118 [Burkholderia vietnamiensis]|nr:hypothetical protein [Burkholderia vietnamiensis]